MVLLSVASIIFFALTPATAQIQIDKPVLPEGYENWPHTQETASCQGLKETYFAKIDKENDNIKILTVTEVNGKVLAYDFSEGDYSKPKLASSFIARDEKWLRFNSMNMEQYGKFLFRLDEAIKASGISGNCIVEVVNSYDDFLQKALDIMKKK